MVLQRNSQFKNIRVWTKSAMYPLGIIYICTDGNIVFRCDSGKNSLVIISML